MRLFLISILLIFPSCSYRPDCDFPEENDISTPIKLFTKGNSLFILNSNADSRFCSGFISEHLISSPREKPVFLRNYLPLLEKGPQPSILGDFDLNDGLIILTDRMNGRFLMMDAKNYDENCFRKKNFPCSTEVIDAVNDPLSCLIINGSHLLLTTTPFGSLRLYSKGDDGRFSNSLTYTYSASLTQSISPLLKMIDGRIYLTFIDQNRLDVFDFDGEKLNNVMSFSVRVGDRDVYSIRDISACGGNFILLTRSPSLLIRTDLEKITGMSPSLLSPFSITCAEYYAIVSDISDNKIGIYNSFSLNLVNLVELCRGASYIHYLGDGVIGVSCFNESKIVGLSIPQGEKLWEIP